MSSRPARTTLAGVSSSSADRRPAEHASEVADPVWVEVDVPRSLNWPRLLLLGAILGACAGLAATLIGQASATYSEGRALAYFTAFGIALGVLLAGVVGVVVDAVNHRGAGRRSDSARSTDH